MVRNSVSDEFRMLDRDSSGALSADEVHAAVAARGLPVAHVDAFIRAADHDGDGIISAAEFRRFCTEREARLRHVYSELDANGDGRLTTEEVRAGAQRLGVKMSSAELRSLMLRLDADRDGALSFEEFRSLLVMLPEVNAVAVFEAFSETFALEQGEYTAPAERAPAESFSHALWAKLYSGSIAGAVSRTATAPIDRLKTLMQVAPSGSGMAGVARAIWSEGGLAAFWRGNTANVLKIAPETSIKFIAFDSFKAAIASDPANATGPERFVAGGAAGAVGQIAIYPLEIAKTRLAVAPAGTYAGLVDVLRAVSRAEGLGALYRGLGTSVVGIVPYAGVDLAVNSVLKERLGAAYAARGTEPSVPALLGCGMASSSVAMLCTYPLNLVRTKLQVAGMPGTPRYAGPLDCVRQTVRAGGAVALYQGLLPNMLKVLPATSISYAVYDALAKRRPPA